MHKAYILVVIAFAPFIACFPSGEMETNQTEVPTQPWCGTGLPWVCGTMDLYNPFRIYKGQRQFAVSLLNAIKKTAPENNHFFSPHSTYHALLLAYFGAEGDTMKSLEKTLGLDKLFGKSDVVRAYKNLKGLKNDWRASERSIQFNTVDKVYVTKDAQLMKNVSDLLGQSIEFLDFNRDEESRAEMNAFVEKVTEGHIKELIQRGSIQSSTKLVLLNAAFFKGIWKKQFNKAQTSMKAFNSVTPSNVEMMHVQDKFLYGISEKLNTAFLDMPYKTENDEKHISMFVFLPLKNTPTAINDFLNEFTFYDLMEYLLDTKRTPQLVDVEFPKISLDVTYESLKNVLEEMGLKDLFGSDANMNGFSNSTRMHFDDIVHKAKLEIDEEGSIAAAATAMFSRGITSVKLPEIPIKFHCDHPFVFMIYDHVSTDVLFTGIYRKPSN